MQNATLSAMFLLIARAMQHTLTRHNMFKSSEVIFPTVLRNDNVHAQFSATGVLNGILIFSISFNIKIIALQIIVSAVDPNLSATLSKS